MSLPRQSDWIDLLHYRFFALYVDHAVVLKVSTVEGTHWSPLATKIYSKTLTLNFYLCSAEAC